MGGPSDPRSDAEKARADLKRNAEMNASVPMSPITRQPSVTPATFGEHGAKAQALSGGDQGLEAGGATAGVPKPGGSQSMVDGEQIAAGRDSTRPDVTRASKNALSSNK